MDRLDSLESHHFGTSVFLSLLLQQSGQYPKKAIIMQTLQMIPQILKPDTNLEEHRTRLER